MIIIHLQIYYLGPYHRVLQSEIDRNLDQSHNEQDEITEIYKKGKILESHKGKEWALFKICRNGKIIGQSPANVYFSRFLHHKNPFLKLAPFKTEQYSNNPYIILAHDILSDEEINYLITKSQNYLSKKRTLSYQSGANMNDIQSGRRRRMVEKSVQYWFNEAEFKPISSDFAGRDDNKIRKYYKVRGAHYIMDLDGR